MLFSIIVVELLRTFDIIKIDKISIERCKMLLAPSSCYALNALLSLIALEGKSYQLIFLLTLDLI